ncbi:Rab3 GTPase-activating protein regulatory subunit N-terminus-domain-containing protein [Tribonema minus]|uniref:Rab3 GTPase-activating protein regulatory subunit N-terminus-domain-containing protein n=1 Tax=Tribonema minus TaxID=303371 RepID=A0A835ZG00_9STRA|nr:Rab3 GTPase-activating protein regulatory subunit N-terminus-domain-containing protein [Tribonema minus]
MEQKFTSGAANANAVISDDTAASSLSPAAPTATVAIYSCGEAAGDPHEVQLIAPASALLWCDGVLVCGLASGQLSFVQKDAQGDWRALHQADASAGLEITCSKLQLQGQDAVHDVAICRPLPSLFEVRSAHAHLILGAGAGPALASYLLGRDVGIFSLRQVAWAVAGKLAGMAIGTLNGTIGGVLGFVGIGRRSSSDKSPPPSQQQQQLQRDSSPPPSSTRQPPSTPLSRATVPLDDARRVITHIWADPSGRYAAAADAFGRVLLLDSQLGGSSSGGGGGGGGTVVRMWKGLRGARCGWLEAHERWEGGRVVAVSCGETAGGGGAGADAMEEEEEEEEASDVRVGLYLVILAPHRCHVEIWRACHGPCVRVLPAAAGARLCTLRGRDAATAAAAAAADDATPASGLGLGQGSLTRCFLLAPSVDATCIDATQLVVTPADLQVLRLLRQPAGAAAAAAATPAADTAAESAPRPRFSLRQLHSELRKLQQQQQQQQQCSACSALDEQRLLTLLGAAAAPAVPPRHLADALAAVDAACEQQGLALSAALHAQAAALAGTRAAAAPAAAAGPHGDGGSSEADAFAALRLRHAAHDLFAAIVAADADLAADGGGGGAAAAAAADGTSFMTNGARGWSLAQLAEETMAWIDLSDADSNGDSAQVLPPLPSFQEFWLVAQAALEAPQDAQPPLQWCAAAASSSSSGGSADGATAAAAAARQLTALLLRPLLAGAFGSRALEATLDSIGGDPITSPLVAGFAAWALALPPRRAARVTLAQDARACVALRWLRAQITAAAAAAPAADAAADVDDDGGSSGGDAAPAESAAALVQRLLQPVYDACRASAALEAALLLAVVAGEAEAAAAAHVESRSLGAVVLNGAARWAALARRLRACLLLRHRLAHGRGAESASLTVQQLEEGRAPSSMAAMLAKDQLVTYDDLATAACRAREADELQAAHDWWRDAAAAGGAAAGASALPGVTHVCADARWRDVMEVAAAHSRRGSGSSSGGGGGGGGGAAAAQGRTLLWFFPAHAQPLLLACHRARWLMMSWAAMARGGGGADALQPLGAAVEHLSYVGAVHRALAGAVAYRLWNSGLRQYAGAAARSAAPLLEADAAVLQVAISAAEQFLGHIDAIAADDDGGGGDGGGDAAAAAARQAATECALEAEGAAAGAWPGAQDRWLHECLFGSSGGDGGSGGGGGPGGGGVGLVLPRRAALEAHGVLLQALRVASTCGFAGADALRVLPAAAAERAFREGALADARVVTNPGTRAGGVGGAEEAARAAAAGPLGERRRAFVSAALHALGGASAAGVYALAQRLGEDAGAVRIAHTRALLARGRDLEAETLLSGSSGGVAEGIAREVVRASRSRLYVAVAAAAAHPTLLAALDPEVCEWINSAAAADGGSGGSGGGGGGGGAAVAAPSLKSTQGLLEAAARAVPAGGAQRQQLEQLCAFVGALVRGLSGGHRGSVGSYG